jgi:hypothetical protein
MGAHRFSRAATRIRIPNPRLPQRRAEIMAGRIPISEAQAEMPTSMRQLVIGGPTAREINWVK